MSSELSDRPTQDNQYSRWRRDLIAKLLDDYDDGCRESEVSLRDFADSQLLPKSTLHDWVQRRGNLNAPSRAVDFFESPEGLAALHAIVLAAHLVFSFLGHAGIRPISRFLKLAGLDIFVATSYGAQRAVASAMTTQILAFEAEQRPKLAAAMPGRRLTVCEDETFPKGSICLVARDPVTGFLLTETLEEKRDTDTWDAVLKEATADLNIEIIQQTSDEASALLSHARHLKAHHSPDLFHILRDINKATVLPLKRRHEAAEAALAKAAEETKRHRAEEAAYRRGPRPVGRPPDFEKRIARAQVVEVRAREALAAAESFIETRQAAVEGISLAYHPFDLDSGAIRSAEAACAGLTGHFDSLDALALEAELSQRSRKLLAKSRRRLPQMVETIRFFWGEVELRLSNETWAAPVVAAFRERLLPAAYLHRVAGRAGGAEERHRLLERAEELVAPLREPGGVLSGLAPEELVALEAAAFDCADVFQRSSSCVEGRNGALALDEHARRGLPARRLQALTVVSNYAVPNAEGTTAAERFFGQSHDDLFEWLMATMPLPARPAQKRPRPPKQTLLEAA